MSRQLSLSFSTPRKPVAYHGSDRRRRRSARTAGPSRTIRPYEYHYTFDDEGRRVLVGLDYEETREFELLEAQLPMYAVELRWLELFNKHEHAREASAA